MNIRRTTLLLLTIVLGIILAYNYFMMSYVMQHGMGMHWRMWFYGQSESMIDLKYIWILLISIVGLFAFDFIQTPGKKDGCCKCGKRIEDERWRICPVCGSRLRRKGGN